MDTLLPGAPAPATAGLLRAAPWMDEAGRRGPFELYDQAVLGEVRLLLIGAGATRWFVPVLDADPGQPAAGTTAFDHAVVDALRTGLRLPTLRGR